jgi:predicted  nucleic acid-binding Zn-ribbon protein
VRSGEVEEAQQKLASWQEKVRLVAQRDAARIHELEEQISQLEAVQAQASEAAHSADDAQAAELRAALDAARAEAEAARNELAERERELTVRSGEVEEAQQKLASWQEKVRLVAQRDAARIHELEAAAQSHGSSRVVIDGGCAGCQRLSAHVLDLQRLLAHTRSG